MSVTIKSVVRAGASLPVMCRTLRSCEILRHQGNTGVPMPRYLTQHTLACLTRQGAEALAQRMQAGGAARAQRVLVNMLAGKKFVEFRGDFPEALAGWLQTEGSDFDFLGRLE